MPPWNKDGRKRNRVLLAAIGAAVLVIALLAWLAFTRIRSEQIDNAGETLSRQNWYLTRGDEKEQIRDHLKVLLVSGTDTFDDDVVSYLGSEALVNQSQADFVLVLIFDLLDKTVTPVQLNRDTMCDVTVIGPDGKVRGTKNQQLTLSHAYGTGGEDSVRNVARTVSKLLFGAPVDNYVSFNMSAVPVITDLVSGVPVTLEEDMTDLDPDFTAGSTVTLTGDNALRFVRTREYDPVDANLPRMSRQRQYLTSLEQRIRVVMASDPDAVTESYADILPYMTTDLNLNSYADYANWIREFKIGEIRTVEGEYTMGEQWAEFHADEDALWNQMVSALC